MRRSSPALKAGICGTIVLLVAGWEAPARAGAAPTRAVDATQFARQFDAPAAISWTPPDHVTTADRAATATTASSATTANSANLVTTATTANDALALDPNALVNAGQISGPVANATDANSANTAGSAPGTSCVLTPAVLQSMHIPPNSNPMLQPGAVMASGTVQAIMNGTAAAPLGVICMDGNAYFEGGATGGVFQ